MNKQKLGYKNTYVHCVIVHFTWNAVLTFNKSLQLVSIRCEDLQIERGIFGVDIEVYEIRLINVSQYIGFNPTVRYNEYSMSSSTGIYLDKAAAHKPQKGIAQGIPQPTSMQQGTPDPHAK